MGDRNHRCPDCHKRFHGGEGVIAHRTEMQGDCFNQLPSVLKDRVKTFQRKWDITPPPLPKDPNDFDLIDDGE